MLNPRQERFCLEFVSTGNATQSYRIAYGTTNDDTCRVNASRLLSDTRIQERLKELADKTANEKICDSVELKEFLSRVVRRELNEEIYLPNGERIQRQNSVRDALKAAELLAKVSGMFVTRAELEISGTVPVVVKDDI